MKTEFAVKDRYAAAAEQQEAALCCPVDYDPQYLEKIPAEVIEKDYGCGDPSNWVEPGDTVLDLGSGTGKICFIASQVVGPEGQVIGVDMTDAMLEVAERNKPIVAENIGHSNVEFRKGRIQDLALDLNLLENELKSAPVQDANSWLAMEGIAEKLRREQTMIADNSVDVVVSNCVLNLVEPQLKTQMFEEIFRVLKAGGRAVISDIVADEDVPEHLQQDDRLWSGCISGAMTEQAFLRAFEDAGFHGVEYVKFESEPWQTVEGIEFRSVTVRAWKPDPSVGQERHQAVIYKGPFKKVLDDQGHAMERGKRYAVCSKHYAMYQREPYASMFESIDPRVAVPQEQAEDFDHSAGLRERDPQETKGANYRITSDASQCCGGDSCC
ncbi:methyltransferase domain-containing protein [Verrucomicrobiaceae bacterium 5K15]|uniref:Arsenite methyltransferase n=1 Tax=Oceaniferula flava TaxID=2800421 RepID=A0AAE2SAE2_9BACT|nr:methyltransferase domain-containing protein [Oceaniferula flavus]MBK1854763.1 methyltransferase domain-containing protein [Oceaniferula flavus]MBM1136069.1 methyltransferase domain-containing protein [Oceaniferula flavus]